MILQALNSYYSRSESLPREGWIRRGVEYAIVLDATGTCTNIELLAEIQKGKTVPREMLLPAIGKQALKHTNSGKDANLLWDNASFSLGLGNNGPNKLASFINTIQTWFNVCKTDAGINSILIFCQSLQADSSLLANLLNRFQLVEEFAKKDPIVVFRLNTDVEEIYARETVRNAYESQLNTEGDFELIGNCLITGRINVPITRNEFVIKNVWGAQSSGANIISFNKPSFESYRKSAGNNAPISKQASFSYTTALNHLLVSNQRIQIGEASAVFWAEERHDLEKNFLDAFGDPVKDTPNRGVDAVKSIMLSAHTGKFIEGSKDTRFHLLGLSPNAARIAIRLWETHTAQNLAQRIARHFEDMKIVRPIFEQEHLPLSTILKACSRRKSDGKYDTPPSLSGDLMRSIMQDIPYPPTILGLILQRCRAEQAKKNDSGKPIMHVSYARAATIKAYLNQITRKHGKSEKEITVSLDISNPDPAYRLGRLFAIFERMQEDASERDLNRTIRDTFFGAAMSTPRSVFPRLIRLNQHHLRDIKRKSIKTAIFYDSILGEINWSLSPASAFPSVFKLEEQGKFALGYYHQHQERFIKNDKITPDEESQ